MLLVQKDHLNNVTDAKTPTANSDVSEQVRGQGI